MRRLEGAVLEAASEAWGVPVDIVVSSTLEAEKRREKKIIGHIGFDAVNSKVPTVNNCTFRSIDNESVGSWN